AFLLRMSVTVTVTCGLLMNFVSLAAIISWIWIGVIPLTLTSLIRGSEIFPSVRTTTVCERSGSFHTLMCRVSDSPTTYPDGSGTAGATTSGFLSAGLSAAFSGAFSGALSAALSSLFAASSALGLSVASAGFALALALCVCANADVAIQLNTVMIT